MSIENPFESEDDLKNLREVITNAAKDIEREFANSRNPWFACVNTVLTGISGYLDFLESHPDRFSPGWYTLARDRYNKLRAKVAEHLKLKQYQDKTLPPEKLRREIINEIDVLREI